MLVMYFAESLLTGAWLISWLIGLLAGKTWQRRGIDALVAERPGSTPSSTHATSIAMQYQMSRDRDLIPITVGHR
jgi:hypothetical protein